MTADKVREAVNQALHGSARACKSGCHHVIVSPWTALGIANTIARKHEQMYGDPSASASSMQKMVDPYKVKNNDGDRRAQ